MNPHAPASDLDPLAPRPDDPSLFRGRFRLVDSMRSGGSPLSTLAVTAVAVVTAAVCVWAVTRCAVEPAPAVISVATSPPPP